METGYKNLEIWKLSKELVSDIHKMTLNDLPKFEMYETGSQIRRSVKSVKANIAEGYGRRMYKQEYLRFLTFAQASLDETEDHVDTLFQTGSLVNLEQYQEIAEKIDKLGKKLNLFIQAIRKR